MGWNVANSCCYLHVLKSTMKNDRHNSSSPPCHDKNFVGLDLMLMSIRGDNHNNRNISERELSWSRPRLYLLSRTFSPGSTEYRSCKRLARTESVEAQGPYVEMVWELGDGGTRAQKSSSSFDHSSK
ncbi:hypothetical protein TNCV_223781 [Trichonephila clavipes]|nr:hypothetical protein TNCV_223781 [Trichonephila clavipes]